MWNPFNRKHLVPILDIQDILIERMVCDSRWTANPVLDLFEYLELHYGVKRKWSWATHKNYLVFDSKDDYLMFLLKL